MNATTFFSIFSWNFDYWHKITELRANQGLFLLIGSSETGSCCTIASMANLGVDQILAKPDYKNDPEVTKRISDS